MDNGKKRRLLASVAGVKGISKSAPADVLSKLPLDVPTSRRTIGRAVDAELAEATAYGQVRVQKQLLINGRLYSWSLAHPAALLSWCKCKSPGFVSNVNVT